MKTPTLSVVPQSIRFPGLRLLTLTCAVTVPCLACRAADITWQDGTASYTNAANWAGSVVPGPGDNAINDHGSNNVVQINVGDPDWSVNQLRAGSGSGNGAFEQNQQSLSLGDPDRAFRLGVVDGNTGVYTLNDGAINYGSGGFNIGELGTGILNVNGGSISGSGNFAVNIGNSIAFVTATMDDGIGLGGYTWFEQGFYAADTSDGVPTAGSTFTSVSQSDHSYKMAPSYAANDAVMIDATVTNATITLTSATACSGLSFLGSAGHGPMTVNYTIHHQNGSPETGSLTLLDWYNNSGTLAWGVGGRVSANGLNFQSLSPGNPGYTNVPYLLSVDVSVAASSDPVTSIDLAYTSGTGVACVMAVSSSSGGDFTPLSISGYNEDMIVEAGAVTVVSPTITDILNQTGGSIDVTNGGQFFVGNYGAGIYNLSGGTNTVHNYIAFGRSGGSGTVNMTGGVLNQAGGGNLLVGTGYQAPSGATAVGVLNQSGGTINCEGQFLCPENSPSSGTYNMSGTAVLNVNNWLAIGRGNGEGILNLTNGTIVKTGDGGNHIDIGAGGQGTLNQSGGLITNTTSDFWLGESAGATWNMNGGAAILSSLHICQGGGISAYLNLNGGDLTVQEITTGNVGSGSFLTLNGGTIHASADNVSFLHGLTLASIGAGGAIFDSQGHDITVAQSLTDTGGGGLTKNGAGTLTLSGVNYIVGPLVVNAGQLVIDTGSTYPNTYSGDCTLADDAGLRLNVLYPNAQVGMSSLTLANSSGATVTLDMGLFGNNAMAPIAVNGTLTVNGTITITIPRGAFSAGEVPLISYASLVGSGSFATGPLPPGVEGYVTNNTSTSSVDLVVTAAAAPRWDGTFDGNWNINQTSNWVDIVTLDSVAFQDGIPVIFNDQATGTTTINVAQNVRPSTMLFANDSRPYTLTGVNSISGATGLVKQGMGSLTIANTNDFTGAVSIQGGTVSVANLADGGAPSAIGASSANPDNLVLAGGQLTYTGPPVAINRGYSVRDGNGTNNSAIDTENNLTLSGVVTASGTNGFVKSGPAQLAYTTVGSNVLSGADSSGYIVQDGTLVFDGSAGGQTNLIQGRLGVDGMAGNATVILTNTTLNTSGNVDIGNIANTTGTLIVNTNVTLSVGSWFIFGDGGDSGGTFTLNGGTLNVNNGWLLMGGRPGAMSTLNINGGVFNKAGGVVNIADGGWNGAGARTGVVNQVGGTFNCSDEIRIGQVALGTGIYNLHGGTIDSTGWFVIGRSGGNGTMNMDGGTLTHTSGGQPAFIIGSGAGDNTLASVGVLNQSGGTLNCNSEYWIAENTLAVGTNNISGTAVLNIGNWASLGRGGHAVINFSAGTVNKTGGGNFIIGEAGGNSLWNQTGGSLNINSELWIGQAGGTTGEFDLVDGTVTNNSWLAVGREGGHGTLNISGGSMTKAGGGNISITHGSGASGTINQTGGAFTCATGQAWVGEDNGTGTWNMDGGTATFGVVHLAQHSSATGIVNLNGGVFTAAEITTGDAGGSSTLNFNGGTLTANASSTNFLHDLTAANVLAGGAVIDSGSNDIVIAQALLDAGGGGGLTKMGSGTLRLNGANTYTGANTVSEGTLAGTGSVVGPVTVASGAAIGAGAADAIGTFTINNTLTLQAGSSALMKLAADSSDQVAGLTGVSYNGSLVVSNTSATPLLVGKTYKLFDSASAGTGNFTSVTVLPVGEATFDPSTGVLTITSSGVGPLINLPVIANGQIILTGTGGTPGSGYTVLSSTNLAAPLTSWVTNTTGTMDGSGSFSNGVPVSASEPERFFTIRVP